MKLQSVSPANKTLVLGTALWGWGVNRETAHQILDRYVALGGCIVDTAVNYPINKRPEDFSMAVNWIADWVNKKGDGVLSIIVKIGPKDNMGGLEVNLERSAILDSVDFFRDRFGASLAAVAVHFDNRGEDMNDADAIAETVDTLAELNKSGLSIGFSGVRYPELYLKAAPELAEKWWIQVKENALTNESRLHYSSFFSKARYLAYGINMGGIKEVPPDEKSSLALRGINRPTSLVKRLSSFLKSNHNLYPAPMNLNELALITSFLNSALSGLIIGPRNVAQLESTMRYWKLIKNEVPADMVVNLPIISSESE